MILEGDFWRDGAVCIRQAFSADEIELARRAIDANLADLSPYAKRASDSSDGAFIEDFCNWQRIPELEQFVRTYAETLYHPVGTARMGSEIGRASCRERVLTDV